jgi:ubiquinone biosynthesis protein UbiJ
MVLVSCPRLSPPLLFWVAQACLGVAQATETKNDTEIRVELKIQILNRIDYKHRQFRLVVVFDQQLVVIEE